MEVGPTKPSGFCPKCDYPIDPGQCPECGLLVTPDTLLSRPESVRVRRSLRRLLSVLAVLALISGGVHAYRNRGWMAWVPSAILLRGQGDPDGDVAQELVRRYNSGGLSTDQGNRLLSNLVSDPRIELRTPHPAHVPLQVSLRFGEPPPLGQCSATFDDLELLVDGRQVARVAGDSEDEWNSPVSSEHRLITCPPLGPGTHTVTVNGTFTATGGTRLNGPRALMARPVSCSATVSIQGELGDYVRGVSTAALADGIASSLVMGVFSNPSYMERDILYLANIGPPVSVASTLWMRPSGRGDFQKVATLCCRRRSREVLIRYPPKSPPLGQADCVDVRLTPDPTAAYSAQFAQYFEGMIEWSDLQVVPSYVVWPRMQGPVGLFMDWLHPPTMIGRAIHGDREE
ncbi:MAG: hypothetical protein JXQ75_16760 [Phycisphaerae bacterium]|nr:hypothetical protein [Phycisphaerae bacterium]